jgi:flagellin
MDTSLDLASRTALNSDFRSILRQISQVTSNAAFDGANLLDGSVGADIQFLANADATNRITLSTQNMSLGGALVTVAAAASIGTVTLATGILTQLNTSISNVNQSLGNLGSQGKQIEAHLGFIGKLTDVLETGVGNLVDADLAKESAKLQALQVQQQLGAQALSIANSAPQIVLQLFRGG